MAEIRLENIVKRFGDVVAVRDFNLVVEDKEFVVFLGPSGCGKTTTLRIIAGLEHPEEGDILIDGQRVNDLSPADRDIAFVFQFYALYPHLSVYDNISFPLKAVKVEKTEIDSQVKRVAEILQITELLPRKTRCSKWWGNATGSFRTRNGTSTESLFIRRTHGKFRCKTTYRYTC